MDKLELKNTVNWMNSDDYVDRFRAEYLQTKIRYEKLHKMCIKFEAGTLDFTPKCSLDVFREQKAHMGNYLRMLEIRAEIEQIDLTKLPELGTPIGFRSDDKGIAIGKITEEHTIIKSELTD